MEQRDQAAKDNSAEGPDYADHDRPGEGAQGADLPGFRGGLRAHWRFPQAGSREQHGGLDDAAVLRLMFFRPRAYSPAAAQPT